MPAHRPGPGRGRLPVGSVVGIALACFLALCLAGGGASHISDIPLVLVRPLAVAMIGLTLALVPLATFRPCRTSLALMGAFAFVMAIQLVPLPPGLWRSLPFRGTYADLLAATGLDRIWRPISIAPDLTLNSLLSLLPPLAALLGAATLDEAGQRRLLAWLLAGMAFSAALGLAQFVGGDASPLYLWAEHSEAVADGVFANRNHQAVFLDCGLVLLGAWIVAPPHRATFTPGTRLAVGLMLALLFLIGVVATGSRTGMLLALASTAYGYAAVIRSTSFARERARLPRFARSALRWGWIALPALLVAMILAGRAASFQRLTGIDALEDERVSSLPVMLRMTRGVLPWGSGFGTFDPLFRTFEPDALLRFTYFNHAHDDFLELVITGGLPAALVVILTGAWWAAGTANAFRDTSGTGERRRAAAVAMAAIGLASAVDYPARTPLMACLIAILAVWLAPPPRPGDRPRKP